MGINMYNDSGQCNNIFSWSKLLMSWNDVIKIMFKTQVEPPATDKWFPYQVLDILWHHFYGLYKSVDLTVKKCSQFIFTITWKKYERSWSHSLTFISERTNHEEARPAEDGWGPHQLGLVVPYRDRFEELLEFVPHMHNYLNAKKVRHKIIIVNQADKHR